MINCRSSETMRGVAILLFRHAQINLGIIVWNYCRVMDRLREEFNAVRDVFSWTCGRNWRLRQAVPAQYAQVRSLHLRRAQRERERKKERTRREADIEELAWV